jgi:16S rRNA (guanine527-N7)-methyltransferase
MKQRNYSVIVSRGTIESINKFKTELIKWNSKINLVSRADIADLDNRHIADSMQISKWLDKNQSIIDLGTGAGFPGIILSVMGYKNIVLVEADSKKILFLQTIKSLLNLDCKVMHSRIEEISTNTIIERKFS